MLVRRSRTKMTSSDHSGHFLVSIINSTYTDLECVPRSFGVR